MDFQKIVAARYAQTETETDAFGRAITVGRLRIVQQMRSAEFLGASVNESVAAMVRVACAVRQIGDDALPFPRTRAEVETRLARLENEGVAAALIAIARLNTQGEIKEASGTEGVALAAVAEAQGA